MNWLAKTVFSLENHTLTLFSWRIVLIICARLLEFRQTICCAENSQIYSLDTASFLLPNRRQRWSSTIKHFFLYSHQIFLSCYYYIYYVGISGEKRPKHGFCPPGITSLEKGMPKLTKISSFWDKSLFGSWNIIVIRLLISMGCTKKQLTFRINIMKCFQWFQMKTSIPSC